MPQVRVGGPWCVVFSLMFVAWPNGSAAQQPDPVEPEGHKEVPGEPPPSAPGPDEKPAPVEASPPPVPETSPATAPETPSEPSAPAPAGKVEEIVVVGSRIKRSTFAQPSSVRVIDRKELQNSGADNMADVVKYLNINYGSEFNTNVSTQAGGTAQFNLRGLGLNSTLVLLNGRRIVESAAISVKGENFVDINTIPLQMVERIEILKGGASAIYGSDAVAGVVNVITRKNFNGFDAQVGGQSTSDFNQHEFDVSLAGGASTERTRLTAMASYFKREPLNAADREFTKNGKNVSALGWPSTYLRLAPNGRPIGAYRDPACGQVPLSAPTTDPTAALPFCTFDFNSYFMLVINEQRANTFLTIDHDISDHVTAFVEGGYSRNRALRTLSPSFALLQNVLVPPNHAYNETGDLLKWYGRPLAGNAPPIIQTFESDTLQTATGLHGDLGGIASDSKLAAWEWHLTGTWGTNQFLYALPDAVTKTLQDALNSCGPQSDPADCWNPFFSGAPNSQAIIERVTGQLSVKSITELTTAGADVSGPVVTLPGGDLAVALGTQVRREIVRSEPDHDAQNLSYAFLLGAPAFRAERTIYAGYAEVVAPLVRALELQGAARLERYSDVGSTFNPMAGLSWTPASTFLGESASRTSRVRLRGTYTTSFRAPSLLQTGGALTELANLFDVSADPMGSPVRSATGLFRAVRTLGNAELKPQKSTAFTAALEWSPLDGLSLQGDYWNYDYTGIIVKQSAQQLLDADFLNHNDPRIKRGLAGTADLVEVSFVNAPSVQTHGVDVDALYRSDFGLHTGVFTLGASLSYLFAYNIPRDQSGLLPTSPSASCSGDKCNIAGLRNQTNFARPLPRIHATFPFAWSYDGHTAGVILHYIGAYKDDDNPRPTTKEFPDISGFLSADVNYSVRIVESGHAATTLKVGVLNLINSDPPRVATGFGYDVLTHDPRGRMIYGRLIQEF